MKEAKGKIKVFLKAVPWMKEFKDEVFVLKYGGDLLEDHKKVEDIAEDINLLCTLGIHPVVVHGGGPQLDQRLGEEDISFEKKEGMRVYSKSILIVAQKVFKGITREIRKEIESKGVTVKLIPPEYVRVKRIESLGLVGKVASIDPLFSKMINGCKVPIMPLFGYDEEGNLCNVNADDMAVSVAETLGAEKLILHTSVDGVLDDKGKKISHLDLDIAEKMIRDGHIRGGMIPKVIHCLESKKVGKIHIINGEVPHALLYEVFTEEGIGTEIVREKPL